MDIVISGSFLDHICQCILKIMLSCKLRLVSDLVKVYLKMVLLVVMKPISYNKNYTPMLLHTFIILFGSPNFY